MHALKFVPGSDTEIEGLGAPYGGPFNGRDLDGEKFTKSTDFCLDWFPVRPLIYNHGLDAEAGTSVVGSVKSWEVEDAGLWVKAQLDKSSQYFDAIKQLVEDGKLFFSSGAMSHLVQKSAKTGEIKRWPWVELSLTPTPANLLATLDFATAEKHFKSAGIDVEGLKAKMDAAERDALPDSDFAYIDSDGNRHLPINDAAHVRSALARFDQTEFESDAAKTEARKRIEAAAEKFGVDVADDKAESGKSTTIAALKSLEGSYEDLLEDLSALLNPQSPFGPQSYCCIIATYPDYVIVHRMEYTDSPTDLDDTYWKVAYSIGEDGEPVLGKATQVEQTYIPTKSFSYDGPLALDAGSLVRHAQALAARTQDLHERRIQEGRQLSAANQALLGTAVKSLSEATDMLQAVLDATSTLIREQAQAEARMTPEALARDLEILSLYAGTL